MSTKSSKVGGTRRRCRPLRFERPGQLQFVTARAQEDRFWLHPYLSCCLQPLNHKARRICKAFERKADVEVRKLVDEANKRMGPYQARLTVPLAKRLLKDLVGACLARAQQHCREQGGGNVEIFGFVAMSNHLHMVVRTEGKNLNEFMRYFSSVLASGINYMTGRRGNFFGRRYDAQPILDDESAAGRLAYTVDNPRAANLVDSHNEWPGQLLCYGLGTSDTPSFQFFNRSAWHKAGRPKSIEPFIEKVTLTLSPLPSMSDLDRKAYREAVEGWIRDLKREADKHSSRESDDNKSSTHKRDKRKSKRSTALGVHSVLATPIGHRPDYAKRKRRPYAFGSPDNLREHRNAMGIITACHQDCSDRYRAGDRNVIFPEGTFAPPIMQAA